MTEQEFSKEYDRLVEHFKFGFDSPTRKELIAKTVKDLDHKWWKAKVDECILKNAQNFDFREAARDERARRKDIELANDVAKASEALKQQMTEEGFKESLKKFNADSLWEAVQNARKARV